MSAALLSPKHKKGTELEIRLKYEALQDYYRQDYYDTQNSFKEMQSVSFQYGFTD